MLILIKNPDMKSLFTYYVLILVPFGILFWLNSSGLISAGWFFVSLLFYVFIYRTYVDGKRLADKNIISKKDIWKMFIPGYRLEYFKELYFK